MEKQQTRGLPNDELSRSASGAERARYARFEELMKLVDGGLMSPDKAFALMGDNSPERIGQTITTTPRLPLDQDPEVLARRKPVPNPLDAQSGNEC